MGEGQRSALRHIPAVVIGIGGVDGDGTVVVLQPPPTHGYRVHGVGQADLTVSADGVKAVEPVYAGDVPLIDPHQHGGALGPGGRVGGEKGESVRLLHAGGEPELPGQRHITRLLQGVGVPEGKGHVHGVVRQVLIAQSPDQHHRHLLPADGVGGTEGAPLVHHTVGGGGLHIGVAPVIRGAVNEGGALGRHGLPAEHAAQHRHEGRPVHVVHDVEQAVAGALHETVLGGLIDVAFRPVAGGIGISGGGSGGQKGAGEHRGQNHGGDGTMLQDKTSFKRHKKTGGNIPHFSRSAGETQRPGGERKKISP